MWTITFFKLLNSTPEVWDQLSDEQMSWVLVQLYENNTFIYYPPADHDYKYKPPNPATLYLEGQGINRNTIDSYHYEFHPEEA